MDNQQQRSTGLAPNTLKYWLALLRTPGIGNKTFQAIYRSVSRNNYFHSQSVH